jgi:small redox-active disulfide protein 2
MVTIKVLGPGCANCKRLAQLVQQVATTNDVQIQLDKVTDYAEIMHWPILATPGLVVNDTLVSYGRIPSAAEVASWLSAAAQ